MRVDQDVIEVLDRATVEGSRLVLNGQLDRKLYERAAKALEAAGGKWNRGAKAHLFNGDAAEAIEPIILTGEIVSAKREFDAFYTPEDLAEEVGRLANISPGISLLEPSAGAGALAFVARRHGACVTCCEIRPEPAAALQSVGFAVWLGDFLELGCHQTGLFDRILMNPPFSRRQDIKHVMHAERFLASDGVLVAIMSASVKFRADRLATDFRAFVETRGGGITDLPASSFRSSGTDVNSVVVRFNAGAA